MKKKDIPPPVLEAKPSYCLIVIRPFGDYRRGDRITDQEEMDEILNSHYARHIHKLKL
jgi:hypothetical protein